MTIIKFEADNCSPCKMLDNFLIENNIEHKKINSSNNIQEFSKYGVRSVPTVIFLDENESETNRIIGFKPNEILNFISQNAN